MSNTEQSICIELFSKYAVTLFASIIKDAKILKKVA